MTRSDGGANSAESRNPAPTGPGADSPRLRVLLVGRTGLDAALRLDRGVELHRAGTPVQAIAEAASPMDADTPDDITVVIGPDVHVREGLGTFVEGLRTVRPAARVMGVGIDDPVLNARIPADATPDAIRRMVRGESLEQPPTPAPTPSSPAPEPADEPEDADEVVEVLLHDYDAPQSADSATPPDAESARERLAREDDVRLIDAILVGEDPVAAALDIIRARTGAHDVVFVPGGEPDDHGAEVAIRGRLLGHLRSIITDRAALEAFTPWLARWIALARRDEQLRRAAFTDDLTGAWNRRYFQYFLGAAIDMARRDRQSVTLLFFDIDDFKRYNDRYGHAAGDQILCETVRLLKSVIRPTDRVCRVGGDEFAVVFHEPQGPRQPHSRPPTSIRQIAMRFQRQICEHRFPKLLNEAPGTLTISGGLAAFPWDGRTADELLAQADAFALQSKRQGKNCITLGPGAERSCQ